MATTRTEDFTCPCGESLGTTTIIDHAIPEAGLLTITLDLTPSGVQHQRTCAIGLKAALELPADDYESGGN